MIAFDLESCLLNAGLAVAGPFITSVEALDWINKGNAPDLALLDFKLRDGSCVPLVRALRDRGVSIVIQSGLEPTADMPSEVRGLPWLSKPFSTSALLNAVRLAVPSLPSPSPPAMELQLSGTGSNPVDRGQHPKGPPMADVLVRRLAALRPLSKAEEKRLEGAIVRTFKVTGRCDISRMGRQVDNCHVLLSGMAAPYRLLPDGRRQITRFCFPGDLIDLDGFVAGKMDHDVAALGACTIGVIPYQVLSELGRKHPNIGLALWRLTLADTAIFREWVVNVGRRQAPQRIAHVLCEVCTRLQDAGLAQEIDGRRTFHWPLTQSDIADATGMSAVHVNRSLQELRGSGLIELYRNKLMILDWGRLSTMSGFEPDYLYPVLAESEGPSRDDVRTTGPSMRRVSLHCI